MQILWQDLRYGIRMLLRRPAFTLIAVATLALGIGANTAIFSVINALLLRSLPYPDSDRLVMMSLEEPDAPVGNTGYTTFVDWRDRSRSFEEMAVIRLWGGALTGEGDPEVISGLRVSANYFRLLGVAPALGREFRSEEDQPSTRFVVVLSHGLWERRFNSDPDIVGKPISIAGQTFTVVGIMPRGFEDFPSANFYKAAEMWAPVGYDVTQPWACRDCQHLKAIARLRGDATLEQAAVEMNGIGADLQREYPTIYPTSDITVQLLQDQFVWKLRPALYVLMAAVGLVLLIACANVANLSLAAATRRSREVAIRTALGASRTRVVRQLLTENIIQSVAGATAGLLLAGWGTEVLTVLSPAAILKMQPVRIDGRVLGFTLLMSILTGLFVGIAPALQQAKQDVQSTLKESGAVAQGGHQKRVRELLVIGEVALALMLLVGAGLLIRSFVRVLDVTPGFQTQNLLTVGTQAAGPQYREDARVRSYYQQLVERVQSLPGVEAAGAVSNLPFSGNMDKSGFHIEEKPLPNPADAPSAERYGITPGYIETMGIPLLRGREFTPGDGPDAPLVIMINKAAADRFWPEEDPLGKRVRLGGPDSALRTIVGIAGNVNHYGPDVAPDPQFYAPHSQWTDSYMQLVVRTTADPSSLVVPVRDTIRSIDPDQPVYQVSTMNQLRAATIAPRRFTLILLAGFAGIALLMAAIGVYGVMSYSVTLRTRELGIRIALGAERRSILGIVIGYGMRLVVIAVAIGLAGAWALTRLMDSLLFGIEPTDPITFAVLPLLLAGVALLACFVPAWRAARVDPITSLRCE